MIASLTGSESRPITRNVFGGIRYTGSLVEHSLDELALVLAIVKRSDDQKGVVGVRPRLPSRVRMNIPS